MVSSVRRKDLSVMTPSVTRSRTSSQVTSDQMSFHISNPNPQNFASRFKGVRDVGYKNFERLIDPTDIIKFGKKVDYDNRPSCDAVMQEHLRQMREKVKRTKLSFDLKRKQEIEFLNHIKHLDEIE